MAPMFPFQSPLTSSTGLPSCRENNIIIITSLLNGETWAEVYVLTVSKDIEKAFYCIVLYSVSGSVGVFSHS